MAMVYNAQLRKLPIGIQTFEKIREGNYLYVDKTEFVWKIASAAIPYFLSRYRTAGDGMEEVSGAALGLECGKV